MDYFRVVVPPGYNVVWYYDQAPNANGQYGILRVFEGGTIKGYTSISPSYPQLYALGNPKSAGQQLWDSYLFWHDNASNTTTQLDITATGAGPDWNISAPTGVYAGGVDQDIVLGVSLVAQKSFSRLLRSKLTGFTGQEHTGAGQCVISIEDNPDNILLFNQCTDWRVATIEWSDSAGKPVVTGETKPIPPGEHIFVDRVSTIYQIQSDRPVPAPNNELIA